MTRECLSYQEYKDELKPFIMKRLKSDVRESRIDDLLKESYKYIVDYCIYLYDLHKDDAYTYKKYASSKTGRNTKFKINDVGYYLHIEAGIKRHFEILKEDLYHNALIYLGVDEERSRYIKEVCNTLSDDISDLEIDISESVEYFYSIKVENLQKMKNSITEVNN
ncbi:hypothetical protein KEI82_002517 [Staphylococcus pseudintermedius]|uniref:hypothetical protein n=1 Tax=Staphylococcus pseudintermedius TaxID=283734 RepID=UPI0018F2C202|nr:hypothetical protein [Staphylococcus pseudintermedius]EGQ3151792.1 hypothetical protein [Staphylococcus pseudintermedius]EGQ3871483.1 hypothetical protein [Staphylococcus pseudintermedius]EHL7209656.1 hypothetical protein [Staphylococcus pseudintermedius]EHT6215645.1 hypothetical protein [Staphylococcus pseudintermedius]EIT0973776.1 hypothetical protein [Staphylococcus pseudintermedius]